MRKFEKDDKIIIDGDELNATYTAFNVSDDIAILIHNYMDILVVDNNSENTPGQEVDIFRNPGISAEKIRRKFTKV